MVRSAPPAPYVPGSAGRTGGPGAPGSTVQPGGPGAPGSAVQPGGPGAPGSAVQPGGPGAPGFAGSGSRESSADGPRTVARETGAASTGPRLAPPPPPLTFEPLAEIATGPTARVELSRIKAPSELSGKLVAVKRLHAYIAQDPQFSNMFADEVWMTASLRHPNAVEVVGWGNDAEGTYLAVELVEGVSLARLMKTVFETREVFSERMVVYLGSEICAGLQAAHELRAQDGEHLRLVHRDLTPGNILVGFGGQIKIADFGLAKAKQRLTKTLTGLLKGHPQYMAPEQAKGMDIDARADLFSLGVVLFELFTGKHPWSGMTELEVFQSMAADPPAEIQSMRPKIDPELASVVGRLLERDPSLRFQSAQQVRDRLLVWLDTHGYIEGNDEAVSRFVRRNAMRQMRWFERANAGEFAAETARLRSRTQKTPARLARPAARREGAATSSSAQAQRRRLRRSFENEATEVSDIAAEVAARHAADPNAPDPPSSSSAATIPGRLRPIDRQREASTVDEPPNSDWGEEIPTMVKKARAAAPIMAGHFQSGQRADAEDIPSFAEEDSDQRTTTVKPKGGLLLPRPRMASAAPTRQGAHTGPPAGGGAVVPLPPPRLEGAPQGGQQAVRESQASYVAAPGEPMATLLDMPRIEDPPTDPESEELPTHPLRARPHLPRPFALPELPPPPTGSRRSDASLPPITHTVTMRADDGNKRRTGGGLTELDLKIEAERLSHEAERLRDEAERAAKIAAHRAVLAQLGAEAAHLAEEALRNASTMGLGHAAGLLGEAHRLEESVRRGEASHEAASGVAQPTHVPPRSAGLTDAMGPMPGNPAPESRGSFPPPRISSDGIPAQNFSDSASPGFSSAPGLPLATLSQDDRSMPPLSMRPPLSPPTFDSPHAREPFGRASRDDLTTLFSGEVFGVPVPVALGVAFATAVALVILIAIIAT